MKVLALSSDEAGALLDDGMLVVRPDQVIAWRGASAPAPGDLWARVAAVVIRPDGPPP
ncbi:MAG: hypothetical protein U1E02_23220 [Hydrogenophaga sp.]|nr:hypothetical protein [Hydrogenophaga sp.]